MRKQMFWLAPSGRVHSLKRCSSAAPARLMHQVQLSRRQFEELPVVPDASTRSGAVHSHRCRCARWSES